MMKRFDTENAFILVIDVQSRLTRLMLNRESLFKNIKAIIQTAHILDLPIVVTEQSPEKIGYSNDEIKDLIKGDPIRKTTFSCCLNNEFTKHIRSLSRKQAIVCGIEAHVCVYQTVCDLCEQQFDVQVIADAVSSRAQANIDLALKRIEKSGATLTSTEMIICELLKGADHPKFKEVMALIK